MLLPRVPIMSILPPPVELTMPPSCRTTPWLLWVPLPPVPVIAMLPPAPVLVTRVPGPTILTPRLSIAPLPPAPVIVTKPVDDSTTEPLMSLTPKLLLPTLVLPVPRILMAPAPLSSCALSRLTPMTFAAVPIAETVAGVAPPPRVMLPPVLLITVPLAKAIAPPPVASRSEFSVTAFAAVVLTSAPLAKLMLRLA